MSREWRIEHFVGSAAEFHGWDVPTDPDRTVWWFEVEGPTIVLGSAQRGPVLNCDAVEAAGIEIVRRRSGGGAVWLDPRSVTWVDLILPSDDPLWVSDVTRSTDWLGSIWVEVLRDLGIGPAVAHRGEMRRGADSDLICFAGRAAGEVFVHDRKVIGVSQRRSRSAARFQCSVLHSWEPESLVEHLCLPGAERRALLERLRDVAVGIGAIERDELIAALSRRLAEV